MVALQLGKRATHKQAVDSGVAQAKRGQLTPQSPGLTSAARTAVGGVKSAGGKELGLTRTWLSGYAQNPTLIRRR